MSMDDIQDNIQDNIQDDMRMTLRMTFKTWDFPFKVLLNKYVNSDFK